MKMEREIENIVKWLKQTVDQTGVDGLLVGVSGGLDSAVVANLIKQACPDNSLGVMLPIYTSDENLKDAKDVITEAGIDSLTLDLTETHKVMYDEIQREMKEHGTFQVDNEQLAGANLRARLRMGALYALATNYNYLVVGTDNSAEWYTGYFTKYGDGGADILPIVEYSKTEVREMAKHLNVPENVVGKKPSADLWEGQTDEKEMGVTYATIDAYLQGETIDEKDKEIIENLHRKSAHKRNPLPKYERNK